MLLLNIVAPLFSPKTSELIVQLTDNHYLLLGYYLSPTRCAEEKGV